VYTQYGDVFAWGAVIATALGLLVVRARARRTS
jgi:hypothetical protein